MRLKFLLLSFLMVIFSCTTDDQSSGENSSSSSYANPPVLTSEVSDWREEIIYFALTDRFYDGDPSNNSQMASQADAIPGDGKTYQGGDFQGLINQLPYLKRLGITALWISSPVTQVWENSGFTGYHGYWAQNFQGVDPHPGNMAKLRELTDKAHKNGIKVIMDIVINHTGSLFNYPGESNVWEPPFNSTGTYPLGWLDGLSWAQEANRKKPLPAEFQSPDFFTRKGGNAAQNLPDYSDESLYGDFSGQRDINTLNPSVRSKMKEIFKWWITQTNIDGFRIDTMKHVELAFWEDFCNEIREWAASAEGGGKEFFMMAEVYSANVSFLNDFTVNNMADSLLGFQMAGSVFDWNDGDNITVFKDSGIFSSRPKTQTLADIHAAVSADTGLGSLSIHTGGDGLTARQKAAYFIDNHDLNRFLNSTSGVSNESASAAEILNLQNALMWLLTWEGIPVIYYGTEQNYKQSLALTGQGEHGDGAGNCEKGNRPRLWKVKNSSNSNTAFSETHSTFKLISGLSALRKSMPELSRGYAAIKLASNTDTPAGKNAGLFGFIRGYGATADPLDDILVVINTHPSQIGQTKTDDDSQCIAVGGSGWGYPAGTVLEAVDIPGFDDDHDGTSDEADESYLDNQGADLFHYTPDQTSITVFANGSQNECYFKVPPQSVKILKVKQ